MLGIILGNEWWRSISAVISRSLFCLLSQKNHEASAGT